MEEIGYKIVVSERVPNGYILTSVGRGHFLGEVDYVCYGEDYKAFPRQGNGPLCVFDSKEHALEALDKLKWYHLGHRFAIFQCTYSPSALDKVWIKNQGTLFLDEMREAYPGTQLADWVQLSKEVFQGVFPKVHEWQ